MRVLFASGRSTYAPCCPIVLAPGYIVEVELRTIYAPDVRPFIWRQMADTAKPVPLPAVTEKAARLFIGEYSDTKVIVQANSAAEGVLILGDQVHPGWQVTVDGEPAPLLRVNHTFRGVMLAPGEHEIAFVFNPHSLRIGILLSMIGVALISIAAISKWERPKQNGG